MIFLFLFAGTCAVNHPGLLRSSKGQLAVILNVIAGLGLFFYGNALSFIASSVTASYLAALIRSPYASIAYSGLYSPVNFFATPLRMMNRSIRGLFSRKTVYNYSIVAYLLIPAIVVTLFFVLYLNASPEFAYAFQKIQINFSPVRMLFSFALGMYWVNYLFNFRKQRKTLLKEALFRDELSGRKRSSLAGINDHTEHKMGIITLLMLIILISAVIVSELVYSNATVAMNAPLSAFSEEVHRSVLALIASIVLSILTLQWFLRYRDKNAPKLITSLKFLSALWMFLNVLLICITAYKTFQYVSTLGLSYRRIGTFFYLLAAMIGVVYTIKKIFLNKNLWYLMSKNSMFALILLVCSSIIPWDIIITNVNIQIANKRNIPLDVAYIKGLRDHDRLSLYRYESDNSVGGKEFTTRRYDKDYLISGTLNQYVNQLRVKGINYEK